MSAFKRLKKSDVFSVPYVAHKQWSFDFPTQPVSASYVILYDGLYLTSSLDLRTAATTSLGEYKRLIFDSINHLFYQSYSGSLLNTQSLMMSTNYESASSQRPTSSYFIYNENPAFIDYFPTHSGDTIQVFSVSKDTFGEGIQPGTFVYTSSVSHIIDDGVGNLVRVPDGHHIGNIFYSHGLAVFTNQAFQFHFYPINISFKNCYTIYENHVTCTVEQHEMNLTYNPSLRVNPNPSSSIKDFATGSVFTPYTTTIGLYNDRNELLMVAKLAQPFLVSPETDITFEVRYDV